jgi:hypothetical protein
MAEEDSKAMWSDLVNAERYGARRAVRPVAVGPNGVRPCTDEAILDCVRLTVSHQETGAQASYLREDAVRGNIEAAYKRGRADETTRLRRIHQVDRLFAWCFLATTVILLGVVLVYVIFGGG